MNSIFQNGIYFKKAPCNERTAERAAAWEVASIKSAIARLYQIQFAIFKGAHGKFTGFCCKVAPVPTNVQAKHFEWQGPP